MRLTCYILFISIDRNSVSSIKIQALNTDKLAFVGTLCRYLILPLPRVL